ncbi:WAT1-related protein At5g64700-like [Vicia villosa]|uniref:WAT1-related protein At5g64700-like n=1 Tax=Vicia villosa TaxID=3911 RepID=UPI00273C5536|nr:WAT1-related protein At5g64700-like [Vicia villosa]
MSNSENIENVKKWFMSSKPLLTMLLVQIVSTGMQLLSRVILVRGTFIFALITYRYLVAAICVVPFALYFEREQVKTFSFNWKVWIFLFVNALVGMTMAIGLFYYGLRDTSATYAVNFLNMIPIFTFLISIIVRMEDLNIRTWSGITKCLGAILCVGGALSISLYKGKEFYIGHHSRHAEMNIVGAHKSHMLRGTLFLIASCCCSTSWFIMQVRLAKVFPLRYCATMMSCFMTSIQSAIIGAGINSSKEAWKLELNLQLITIVYAGVLATAVTFCLLSWTIALKGPTYPSMFNPLALVFVAISETFILGEPIHDGTLLGMVLIIMGLYSFLWAKSNEMPHFHQSNVGIIELSTSRREDPTVTN